MDAAPDEEIDAIAVDESGGFLAERGDIVRAGAVVVGEELEAAAVQRF